MYCKKCGSELTGQSDICQVCGAKQSDTGYTAKPIIADVPADIPKAPRTRKNRSVAALAAVLIILVAASGVGYAYTRLETDDSDSKSSSSSLSESSEAGGESSSDSSDGGDQSSAQQTETATTTVTTTTTAEATQTPPETTTTAVTKDTEPVTTTTSGQKLTPPDTEPAKTTPPDMIDIPEDGEEIKAVMKDISSMFGQPYQDVENLLQQKLGVKFVYNYDEEYRDFNNNPITSTMLFTGFEDSKVPFLEVGFSYAVIEYDENGLVRLVGFHYSMPGAIGEVQLTPRDYTDCASKATLLYNKITSAYGKADDTQPMDDKGAAWYSWTNNDGCSVWLCYGRDMWGEEGYNDVILSFSDPYTNIDD